MKVEAGARGDGRGNMISDGTRTFGYDFYNRLTSVSGGITLEYDPLGRLWELAGSATRRFQYDGADLIAEYDSAGVMMWRYVHGPGTDEPLALLNVSDASRRYWYHADERGSVVARTSSASGGVPHTLHAYDEYGNADSLKPDRFGYTGQFQLIGTGLYHYKNRAYHPELGRFMQTDPIGQSGGINIYAYVGNDPVNATDPTGLLTCVVSGPAIETTSTSCGGGFSGLGGTASIFGFDDGFFNAGDGARGLTVRGLEQLAQEHAGDGEDGDEGEGSGGDGDGNPQLCEPFTPDPDALEPGGRLATILEAGRRMENFRVTTGSTRILNASVFQNRITGNFFSENRTGYASAAGQVGTGLSPTDPPIPFLHRRVADVVNTASGNINVGLRRNAHTRRIMPFSADIFVSDDRTLTLVAKNGTTRRCNG